MNNTQDLEAMRAGAAELKSDVELSERNGMKFTVAITEDVRQAVNYIAHLEQSAAAGAARQGGDTSDKRDALHPGYVTSASAPAAGQAGLAKLRELALAATPGPWTATHWNCHAPTTVMRSGHTTVMAETSGFGRDSTECAKDAAFIAAANPATILELLDHLATPVAATEQATSDQALKEMEARKDAAYYERNQVVAALAKCFPSGVARTAIEGWSEDWHGCVYIDLPTGQVSWHFHDSQAHLFADLPPYAGKWDGHDTPEKYRRVASLATPADAGAGDAPTPSLEKLMRWDIDRDRYIMEASDNGEWVHFADLQALAASNVSTVAEAVRNAVHGIIGPGFHLRLANLDIASIIEREVLARLSTPGAQVTASDLPEGLADVISAKCAEVKALVGDPWGYRPTDAQRYERLRVLGVAPCGTKQLESGTVLRFQNLDDFVDADIAASPSRGEAAAAPVVVEPTAHVVDIDRKAGQSTIDAAIELGTAVYTAPVGQSPAQVTGGPVAEYIGTLRSTLHAIGNTLDDHELRQYARAAYALPVPAAPVSTHSGAQVPSRDPDHDHFTPEQVRAIADGIKTGDGWSGEDWDFALVNAAARHIATHSAPADRDAIRDQALEEAARFVEDYQAEGEHVSFNDIAFDMRKLKSQPSASPTATDAQSQKGGDE